jgi:HEAT repeat protein
VGFIVTFQRGVEWAATGRVTQRIPGDFPAVRRESPTPSDVRRWTGYRPPVLEEILEALKAYEYGQDEKILSRLRDFVLSHKDSSESSASCEEQLVSFLESDASLAAKMAVCRHLRQVGTKRSVPVLEEMLVQKDTSDHARYALEKIPGPEAERALLRSLSKCSRGEKIGIISSLGQRKARAAVPELSRLLNESDEAVADASAKALGQIASPSAAKTLTLSLKKVQGDLLYQMATSLLRCAEVYLNQENLTEAAGLYAKMTGSRFPVSVRQAALKGQIASDKDNSRTIILDKLDGPEQNIHIAAIGKIRESIQDSDIQSILDRFSSLPEMSQVAMLEVLSRYPRQAVLPSVAEATKSSSQLVRTAALEALKTLGDVSVVPLLAKHAAQSKGRERQAARDCLWNLKGPDIDLSIILNLIKISEPSVKRELIRSIGERRIKDGKHVLFDLVFSPDSLTRMYALRSLGRVSEPSDMPLLLDLLLGLEKDPEKVEMRKVIAAAAARIPHRNRKADEVREKLADVEDAQRRSELYRVLGFFGDNSVLPLLRQALLKEDSPVYDGAVRALADWPDSTPKDDLLLVAQTAGEVNHRVLALRAYIQMTGSDRFRLPSAVVQSLQKGLELAERPDEKKKILALLPQFICAEAVKMAQSLLTDKTVHAEAKAALHKILYTYLTNRYHVFR